MVASRAYNGNVGSVNSSGISTISLSYKFLYLWNIMWFSGYIPDNRLVQSLKYITEDDSIDRVACGKTTKDTLPKLTMRRAMVRASSHSLRLPTCATISPFSPVYRGGRTPGKTLFPVTRGPPDMHGSTDSASSYILRPLTKYPSREQRNRILQISMCLRNSQDGPAAPTTIRRPSFLLQVVMSLTVLVI